jgi:uncharacterized protein (DUF1697 family)
MTGWAALLRAVNVGGTGKLPMNELKALCEELGLAQVQTYIASGNVVFASDRSEAELRESIAAELLKRYGKPIGVLVRSAAELAELAVNNPWPDRLGNRVVAIFVDEALSLDGVTGQRDEALELGSRAIYVDYRDGMAVSRLQIPCAKMGTARNMNTIAKLAGMAARVS